MKKFILLFVITFFSCDNMKKNKQTDIDPNDIEYVDLIGEFPRKICQMYCIVLGLIKIMKITALIK